MSLVNLAHVCSHLQNASKARLGITSIPLTKLHLRLCLGLQKQGFFSSVQVAGLEPPIAELPSIHERARLEREIEKEPWGVYGMSGSAVKAIEEKEVEDKEAEVLSGSEEEQVGTIVRHDLLPASPGKRRIWLGLKYYDSLPVLSEMRLISKPTRRIWMKSEDIANIVRGRRAGIVKGLTRPGECMFVSTDKGIWESRECVERKVGGMLLCRVV
jgi:ribosomal protein S8